jgi:hypothetical protein
MRARSMLVCALLAVVGAGGGTPAMAGTAAFGAPVPSRPLLQWMPENFGTGHTYTHDQAIAAAQRYDVIVAFTKAFTPYVADMRAANPNLVLLAYTNGMFVQPTQGPTSGAFPSSWYAYDANGNAIQNSSNHNWLMNPASSGWVQNRASNCATMLAQSGYDGCMLDTLGVSPLTPGYTTSLPFNQATGANWTRSDWLNATTQLSATVRSTVSPSLVVGNGLKDGPNIAESSVLFNGINGAMAESFLRMANQPLTTYPTVATWQQNVNMLLSPPKPILIVTKAWASGTTDQVTQWHLFSLASFLLATDGRSYFYFTGSSSDQPISVVPWTVNIGDPTGAYALQDGVYERPFANGLVMVNPGTTSVTVPLTGTYTAQDGTVVSGSLVVAADSGQILTKVAPTAPDPPTNVSATAGNGSATVSFTPPANDGGSPITSYTVTANDGTSQTDTQSPITVTGLTNGTAYTFTVTATNNVGTSSPSAASNSVTPTAPATAPDPPTNVSATAGNGSATVSFTPPANDGGSPITSYTVTANDGTSQTDTQSPITVTGLTNGTAYTFTVTATNGVGTSSPSGASNSVTPTAPATAPDPPTNVSATAGNGSATVTFTPPANDGGSPITSYTVTANDGTTKTDTQSPTTITGLTNGTGYTFTVTAANSIGTSPPSAPSNSVTPTAPPTLAVGAPPTFGVAGIAYSYQLTATGGTAPYTWKLATGSLPTGLKLSATKGTLTGTPTAAGSWTFSLKVTDSSTPTKQTATAPMTMQIYARAADGSGTETVSPQTATRGSSGNVFVLTYTAPQSGALYNGKLRITVPTGWTAPSTIATSAGLVTTSNGTIAASSQAINVTGIRLAPGATLTITYGSTVNGAAGATVSSKAGTYTFTTKETSSGTGTLTAISGSPTVVLS